MRLHVNGLGQRGHAIAALAILLVCASCGSLVGGLLPMDGEGAFARFGANLYRDTGDPALAVKVASPTLGTLAAAVDECASGSMALGLARLGDLGIATASASTDRNLADGALAYERESDGAIFVNRDIARSLWFSALAHELAHRDQRNLVPAEELALSTVANATTAAYCLNPREIDANFNAILAVASRADGRRCPQAADSPSAVAVLLAYREGLAHGEVSEEEVSLVAGYIRQRNPSAASVADRIAGDPAAIKAWFLALD